MNEFTPLANRECTPMRANEETPVRPALVNRNSRPSASIRGYVEQFGTGTQRMIDLLQQAGLPEPEFESREHFFRVLFRKPVPVEKQFAHSDLNGRQVIALRSLEKSKRITRKEYEELTGASNVTAKRDLTDLVNKRVLVRRGATRNLWYELSGHPMTRK